MPLLITSAQRAALSIMNSDGKLCMFHHNQTDHLNCPTQLHGEILPLAFHCYLMNVHMLSDSVLGSCDRFNIRMILAHAGIYSNVNSLMKPLVSCFLFFFVFILTLIQNIVCAAAYFIKLTITSGAIHSPWNTQ